MHRGTWQHSWGGRAVEALPHFAFVDGVHRWSGGTFEVLGEFLHVGEGADDTEASGRVESGRDAQLDRFVPVYRAPGVGRTQPEQLQASNTYLTGVAEHDIRDWLLGNNVTIN